MSNPSHPPTPTPPMPPHTPGEPRPNTELVPAADAAPAADRASPDERVLPTYAEPSADREQAAAGAPSGEPQRSADSELPADDTPPASATEPSSAAAEPPSESAPPADAPPAEARAPRPHSERIAKVIARAGLCSRRDAETWIEQGRVAVNGVVLTAPGVNVSATDDIRVDGKPLPARERTRLWLFHKPRGVLTTNRDDTGRPTVFDALPPALPRVITVGRLDYDTEGLLLLTNDGGLARVLELPATGWLRKYRVRAYGKIDQATLDALKDGIAVDGMLYGPIEASLDQVQGDNVWLTLGLREGKNREVKNVLGALGLMVNRLIRISFGPFALGTIAPGEVVEVPRKQLGDQLGPRLIAEAGVDLSGPAASAPVRPGAGLDPGRVETGRASSSVPSGHAARRSGGRAPRAVEIGDAAGDRSKRRSKREDDRAGDRTSRHGAPASGRARRDTEAHRGARTDATAGGAGRSPTRRSEPARPGRSTASDERPAARSGGLVRHDRSVSVFRADGGPDSRKEAPAPRGARTEISHRDRAGDRRTGARTAPRDARSATGGRPRRGSAGDDTGPDRRRNAKPAGRGAPGPGGPQTSRDRGEHRAGAGAKAGGAPARHRSTHSATAEERRKTGGRARTSAVTGPAADRSGADGPSSARSPSSRPASDRPRSKRSAPDRSASERRQRKAPAPDRSASEPRPRKAPAPAPARHEAGAPVSKGERPVGRKSAAGAGPSRRSHPPSGQPATAGKRVGSTRSTASGGSSASGKDVASGKRAASGKHGPSRKQAGAGKAVPSAPGKRGASGSAPASKKADASGPRRRPRSPSPSGRSKDEDKTSG